MDKLEKYIHENRSRFDDTEPKDELWTKISGELKVDKNKTRWLSEAKIWKIAAVILLLATSWLVFDKFQKAPRDSSENAGGYLSEFRSVEQYYMSIVAEKKRLLEKASEDDPEYRKEFLKELEDLDKQYDGLKENLKFGNQEEIIDALIVNLQLRIEILNRQLEIIKQLNKKENESVI